MNKNQSAKTAVIVGGILTLTLTALLFGLAWPVFDAKAGPTLPPRKLPAFDDDDDDGGDSRPVGAYIELHTQPAAPGAWSVVQWQDNNSNWHTVDGWQGHLDSAGIRRWWVAAKDFGKGPFRWQISGASGQTPLGTSPPFYLPDEANDVLIVTITSK